MTDWASWGTSAGTLVLAGATFVAVRSSSRSARIAERTLLAGMRPVLASSRRQDPAESVQFADGRVFEVRGGSALAVEEGEVIYLAIHLRNVGAGIAGLRAYRLEGDSALAVAHDPRGAARHRRGEPQPDPDTFSEQQRDLYVPSGDLGFWQAAQREPGEALHESLSDAIATRGRITVDLLYTDHEGGQPTITRFVLLADGADGWRCDVTRHWSLDSHG
jgi:hypothetical protein